ncbi:MAG: PPC domain-containing DNA-binding protein [Syntrophomonas sp.]
MKFKQFGSKYVVSIARGEEIVESLRQLCSDQHIKLGSMVGIGAVNRASIGVFEIATGEYHTRELSGDMEITNLTGNISTLNGEVYLHIHISLSDSSYQTLGGHLNSAYVSGACEIIIDAIIGEVGREVDPDVGLNLFKL